MSDVKISVVSYLNSKPFIYGIEHSGLLKNFILEEDMPAVCAQKLIAGNTDIGLVPVAILPLLKDHYFVSDYCIGATQSVTSVMMFSRVPLENIKTITLDYQSRTSVALVKILAEK